MERFYNLILRGSTIGFRSILIFYIAKSLLPEDMATYGLITVTLSYLIYILGIDFYTYYTREFVKKSPTVWGGYIKNVGIVFLFTYLLCVPIIFYLYKMDIIKKEILFYFILLLIFEHLNQELNRIMIMNGDVLYSSIVNFVRYALWAPLVIFMMSNSIISNNINNILIYWVIFGFIALLISFYRLQQYNIQGWDIAINKKWIYTGLCVSLPLLIGTLALRGVFTFDRFWLKTYFSIEYLAAYAFFGTFAAVIGTIVDSLIIAYTYPKLIKLFNDKKILEYNKEIKKFSLQIVFLSVLSGLILYYITDFFVSLMDLKNYIQYMPMLIIILIANILCCVANIPHYILYSQNKDKVIYWVHIILFLLFMFFLYMSTEIFNSGYVVPITVLVFYLFLFIFKSIYCYKFCEFR